MLRPRAEQNRLLIPPTTLDDTRHRDQFGIGAGRRWARACELRAKRGKQVTDEHIHPGAAVVEITYHHSYLGWTEQVDTIPLL